MKIYLCARYSRLDELQQYAALLRAEGHLVTSRWHAGGHELSDVATDTDRARLAMEDAGDLALADTVIAFTEAPDSPGRNRGGRHVEFGIALEQRKRIIIVGPRENVFHYLPRILVFPAFSEVLIRHLRDKRHQSPVSGAAERPSQQATIPTPGGVSSPDA